MKPKPKPKPKGLAVIPFPNGAQDILTESDRHLLKTMGISLPTNNCGKSNVASTPWKSVTPSKHSIATVV
jgi:hypothetical protein